MFTYLISSSDAREVREAIHIRINNPMLNCNTGKMYISEIFNSLPVTDRPSDRSVQMADTNLQHYHTNLTIPINRFSRAVCLAN